MDKRPLIAALAVVLLALGLRAYDLSYGLPLVMHPDEPKLLQPAARIAQVSNLDFDPEFFYYPSLSIYVLAGVFWLKGALMEGGTWLAPSRLSLEEAVVIGRWVTTLFGLATVALLYATGSLMEKKRVGLLAALLLAVAPFHALDSHYLNVDIPMTFWCLLSFYFLQRWVQGGRLSNYFLGAACIGLAGATKYNGLVLLALLPTVAILRISATRRIAPGVLLVFAGVAICSAAFLLAAPYTILRFEDVFEAIHLEQQHVRTGHWGWDLNTGGLLHHRVLYQWAAGFPFLLGFPLYGLFLAGTVRLLRRPLRRWILLFVAFLVLYLPSGLAVVVFPRYLTPLIPLMALVAADFIEALARRANPSVVRVSAISLLALTLVYTTAMTTSLLRALSPQTPTLASEWIDQNVPPGSEVAVAIVVWTMSFADHNYRIVPFHLRRTLAGEDRPEWLVVNSWYDLAFQRGKIRSTPPARFLRKLGDADSPYEEIVKFEARYLNEDFYGLLDPYFKNQFQSPDTTVYRRRDRSDDEGEAAPVRR